MSGSNQTETLERQVERFRAMLPLRLELDAVSRRLSAFSLARSHGLDIGFRSPVMSHVLRGLGGTWRSAVLDETAVAAFSAALDEPVAVLRADGSLPFEDKQFDWVVVGSGVLSFRDDDGEFVRELHRVMKPAGNLLISVEHDKVLGLAPWLARGLRFGNYGSFRRGAYSEPDLFACLKSGFDVLAMRSYCRFWTQLVRFWEASRVESMNEGGGAASLSFSRLAGLFYRIAYQLDALLFFTRGYLLMAHARRHPWRARNAPVLNDGRTISEAVLTRVTR